MSTPLARLDFWVRSAIGPAVVGAYIYIVAQPANITLPPSPLIQLYADNAGITPLAQPLQTDGLGHVSCYGLPQTYTLIVSQGGVIQNYYIDQRFPDIAELLPPTGNGSLVVTATNTFSNAAPNSIVVTDGAGNLAAYASNIVYASAYSDFSLAVAACPIGGTIAVNSVVPAASSVTVPVTATVVFTQGGMLNIALGQTITFNNPVQAGPYQIFQGSGVVAGLSVARPEWWGSTATVQTAVSALNASTGGTVLLQLGTYISGTTTAISTPHVTIQGSGMPGYNSTTAPTALSGGTIIQGTLAFQQGADFLIVRDLGVDCGSAYVNATLGGNPVDAFSLSNAGQVISSYQVQSPLIENVACLGYSTSPAFHCMLVENVNNAYIHNVSTVYNQHGLVLKGTNSRINGAYLRGHSIDSLIVKSDAYAPASDIDINNVNITYLASQGDTKGIVLQSVGASLQNVNVSNVTIESPLNFGIQLSGANSSFTCTGINLSNIAVNYPGGSPSSYYALQFVNYVANVSISNLYCYGMWAGIAPNTSVSFMNDFFIVNSSFVQVAHIAIETYGRWLINNCSFVTIAGFAIQSDSGVASLGSNQFTSVGTNLVAAGGTFGFGYSGVLDAAGDVVFPANVSAAAIFSSAATTVVTTNSSATVLSGSGASSGLIVFRDNTGGGSAVFLIDPNSGAQLLGTSQITGLAVSGDVTFSAGTWHVTLTTGTTPRTLAWTISIAPNF